ncbi:MAG TPA: alpha-amylase family glycosyl hydrolase [Verrucomicrobiae bacterium]|nr:alpha-amylase family glycosyl hydrolase [Verrucomicrobiae bacterium]
MSLRAGRSRRAASVFLCALLVLGSCAATFAGTPADQPARHSPGWLRRGVVYEIFPRDFSPRGDLNGVTARLDDLADLGVTILWVMPIHPIGEKFRKGTLGSPYAVRDYYAVDPDYGTLGDFQRLVSEAHKRKLKVIMDVVADHTAWDSVMMAHPEFYKQDGNHHIIPPTPEWTDVAGLNYENAELRAYMLKMLAYWVRTCDVDGFRCDVASMVPTDFWVAARAELARIKPDIMMLAEASKPELLTEAFDIDYAWPLLGALNNVLLDDAPATALRDCWLADQRQFPKGALHLRISDDHDEPRAVARFGIRGALAASALMFSLDGVPLLYNGMEVGDATESGDPALFGKFPICWEPKGRSSRATYQALIKLRKEHRAFTDGSLAWLPCSNERDTAAVLRAGGDEEFLTVINLSSRPLETRIEVKAAPEFQAVKIAGAPAIAANDFPLCHLKGYEWRIYRRSVKSSLAFQTADPAK